MLVFTKLSTALFPAFSKTNATWYSEDVFTSIGDVIKVEQVRLNHIYLSFLWFFLIERHELAARATTPATIREYLNRLTSAWRVSQLHHARVQDHFNESILRSFYEATPQRHFGVRLGNRRHVWCWIISARQLRCAFYSHWSLALHDRSSPTRLDSRVELTAIDRRLQLSSHSPHLPLRCCAPAS